MKVESYELTHGLILKKLISNRSQVCLKIYEGIENDCPTYVINNEYRFLIKSPTYSYLDSDGVPIRQYLFSDLELTLGVVSKPLHNLYIALVVDNAQFSSKQLEVCLLGPSEIKTLAESDNKALSNLFLTNEPRSSHYSIDGWKDIVVKIDKSAFEQWDLFCKGNEAVSANSDKTSPSAMKNPYFVGSFYYDIFELIRDEGPLTKNEVIEILHERTGKPKGRIGMSVSVVISPKEEGEGRGDCRGSYSAHGEQYFVKKDAQNRLILHERFPCLQPRIRGKV
ncbi:hypothetical protein P3T73_03330 [Kiritimatiellota bacterium B12222]|nr:hypothetical protein P3T73_03330 [Kiritimatiellota bacterium B12222]